MPRAPRRSERGVSLVALMVAITLMMIAMAIMLPAWSYVTKNEREQELLFRGEQIARAIERYKAKNGNTLPTSLEMLVKGRYLRKLYKDPMVPDGKWRLMHPGEPPIPEEDLRSSGMSGAAPRGQTFGPIEGVASRSTDESLRCLNARRRYSAWFFIANQQRMVTCKVQLPPGARPGGLRPGATPARGRR